MSVILIKNIKLLVNAREDYALLKGEALSNLPQIENAYLLIEDDTIVKYGAMFDSQYPAAEPAVVLDATGKIVMPAWCDSHTHIVFAGSREQEFVYKIKGMGYAEIAAKGGGILNSAAKVAAATEGELYNQARKRLDEIVAQGTGAVEIKSGYGLSVESELKMLRVIKKLSENSKVIIKSTFLGAHAIPSLYKENREDYIQLIIEEMLPKIAAEKLADYIDVFCEQGFFTPAETINICNAGKRYGLLPKIHANQLNISGGVQAGVAVNAVSVDHLETVSQDEIDCLKNTDTIATLLPNPSLYLRMQYAPARQMLNDGLAIALASDYNPGSSPSGNMNLVVSLACMQMKLLPEEAINAATINGAYAMGVANEVGTISVGKKANLIITKEIPSLTFLPYAFGSNLIDKVMISGEFVSN